MYFIGPKKSGFTLVELLVGIAITGMIMGALYRVTGQILSVYGATEAKQNLVPAARYALERMVAFVQESSQIQAPAAGSSTETLTVTERLLDQYANATHTYTAQGDTIPDADQDADALVNEGGSDVADLITFDLDKTDAGNWRLMEQMPDYSSSLPGLLMAKKVLCEHVKAFECKRISAGMVQISLTLQQGIGEVTLRTIARVRWMD